MIVSRPTIAERHFILSLVEGGFAAPADYMFDCLLSRITASAVACSKKTVPAGAQQGADYACKSARLLAEGYQFDLAGVDATIRRRCE